MQKVEEQLKTFNSEGEGCFGTMSPVMVPKRQTLSFEQEEGDSLSRSFSRSFKSFMKRRGGVVFSSGEMYFIWVDF